LTHHHEFFLARGAFAESFAGCLALWFENYRKVETPNGLAMSILASNTLWPHVEFLSLMQALEGFHRALYDGFYMCEKAYSQVEETMVKAIPAEVSTDHRSSLKSRIHYGNEITLAKRLKILAEIFSEPVRSMLFGDAATLPRKWVDTRNYYTHWDDALRANILSGQDMIYAIARLRSFLRILYLNSAGLPEATLLSALIGKGPEAQFLIQIRGMERRVTDPTDTTGTIMWINRGSGPTPASNSSPSGGGSPSDSDT
jgi:hypothetical protein